MSAFPSFSENPTQRRLDIKASFTELNQCIKFVQQCEMNQDEKHRVLHRLANHLESLTQEYILLSNDKYQTSYITNEFLKKFSGPVEIIEFDKKLIYLEVVDFGAGGIKAYLNAQRRFLRQQRFVRQRVSSEVTPPKLT